MKKKLKPVLLKNLPCQTDEQIILENEGKLLKIKS